MDPFARLSPVGTLPSEGREYTPSSVSFNEIRNGGPSHANHSRIDVSSSPTSSNSSLTSTSFDSLLHTAGGVDLNAVDDRRDDQLLFGGKNTVSGQFITRA